MTRRKSFYAHSVEAALTQARREFGEEAYLLESRRARPECRHLGAFEVVVEDELDTNSGAVTPPACRPGPLAQPGEWGALSSEVERLRAELQRVSRLIYRPAAMTSINRMPPGLAEVGAALAAAEVPEELALELVTAAAAREPHSTEEAFEAAREEIAVRLPAGRSKLQMGGPATLALTGPPGIGKTSTLVKLAARYGAAGHVSTLLVSTDTCRVGGADQLAAYAAILGIPCLLADTPGALVRILEEHARKQLILIDTPGFSNADACLANDWARFFSNRADIETHLLLPASARLADLRRVMQTWAPFRPSHVVLSRLDETSSLGPVISAAIESERPVSFLTNGQSIPEDLDSPTSVGVATLLLQPPACRKAAA